MGPEQRSSGVSGREWVCSAGSLEAAGEGEDRHLGSSTKGKLGVASAGIGKPGPRPFLSTQKGLESLPHGCTEACGEAQSVPERALSHLHKPKEPVMRTHLKPHHCGC